MNTPDSKIVNLLHASDALSDYAGAATVALHQDSQIQRYQSPQLIDYETILRNENTPLFVAENSSNLMDSDDRCIDSNRDKHNRITSINSNHEATEMHSEQHNLLTSKGNHHKPFTLNASISTDIVESFVDSIGRILPSNYSRIGESNDISHTDLVNESIQEEPKNNHDVKRTTSAFVAGWNVFNLIQGIGIMGIPYAFYCAGWIAIPLMLVIGMLCCFTGKLIAECLYDRLPDRTIPLRVAFSELARINRTYACIAGKAYPMFGKYLTASIVITELFGAAVLYTILLGTSTSAIASNLGIENASITTCMAIFGYLCLPILVWPSMQIVAWFSVIAGFGLVISIATVFISSILEIFNSGPNWYILTFPNLEMAPISFGIIVFSFCAHGVLPGIEGGMRFPHVYKRMLNITFLIAIVVKLAFGLLCSLTFGAMTKQSVTDSIIHFKTAVIVTHIGVAVNVFFSFPIIFFVIGEHSDNFIMDYVNPKLFDKSKFCSLFTVWVISSRGAMLSFCILVGVMVPQFALIMGLVGSFTGSLLCFILPCLFHLNLFWNELSHLQRGIRISIIILGVMIGIFGIIFSIKKLQTMSK